MAEESKACSGDDIFGAINDLRADPQSFIPLLEARLSMMDDNNILRVPGQKAVKVCHYVVLRVRRLAQLQGEWPDVGNVPAVAVMFVF